MTTTATTGTIDDLPELIPEDLLSGFLRISKPTLARWRGQGTGPRYRKLGHAVRYAKADVVAWLEAA